MLLSRRKRKRSVVFEPQKNWYGEAKSNSRSDVFAHHLDLPPKEHVAWLRAASYLRRVTHLLANIIDEKNARDISPIQARIFSFPKFQDFPPFFFSSIENSPSNIEVWSAFDDLKISSKQERIESIVNDKRYFEVFPKAKVTTTTTTTTRQERALCH